MIFFIKKAKIRNYDLALENYIKKFILFYFLLILGVLIISLGEVTQEIISEI